MTTTICPYKADYIVGKEQVKTHSYQIKWWEGSDCCGYLIKWHQDEEINRSLKEEKAFEIGLKIWVLFSRTVENKVTFSVKKMTGINSGKVANQTANIRNIVNLRNIVEYGAKVGDTSKINDLLLFNKYLLNTHSLVSTLLGAAWNRKSCLLSSRLV